MADKIVDARHLKCPMPIFLAQKAMRHLEPGGTLAVLATDPGSPEDFDAFCRVGRHEMLERDDADGSFRFLIRKGG